MPPSRPRSGIERKILTTILWVGILPMAVVFILGYFTARNGQRTTVEQSLLNAVQKTAEGVHFDASRRALSSTKLASAIAENTENLTQLKTSDADRNSMLFWLNVSRRTDIEASTIALYGLDLDLVLTTDETKSDSRLEVDLPEGNFDPFFYSFGFSRDQFFGITVTPIIHRESQEIIGYLSHRFGVNSIISYVMGAGLISSMDSNPELNYQLVYMPSNGGAIAIHGNKDEFGEDPAELPSRDGSVIINWLTTSPVDLKLNEILSKHEDSDTHYIAGFTGFLDSVPINSLVAYQRLNDFGAGGDVYLIAFQSTNSVFTIINRIGLIMLVVCFIFICVLCINAYRDVHNNIVRPVSLLNEGAQIIRQGDFDLKLKIGTGDEIEELAMSFNKMALALKLNMQQLEDSEEKYRNLVTDLRDGIFQTDLNGNITFVNPATLEIMGYDSAEQILNLPLAQFFEDTVQFSYLQFGESLEASGNRERYTLIRKDEQPVWVELTRNIMLNETDEPIGLEGTLRDITVSIHLEDAARERSERISAINQIANAINSSLEAGRLYESLVAELQKVLIFDYASVTLLDDSGSRFEGRQLWPDTEEAPGYTFILESTNSSSSWVVREEKCLLSQDLPVEFPEYVADFSENTKSCLCVPLYSSGRIIGILNLGSQQASAYRLADVETIEAMAPHLAVAIRNAQLLTNLQLSLEEVTRAREKLHEVNDELKTLDELKTNLLSNVSHELRTPLVSVMGYTDMILNGKVGPVNNTQQEYLQISLRNIEKLVTLIENLLDFSRLHRGDDRLVFNTFDLVDCVESSLQVVQPLANSNGIELRFKKPPNAILIEGDKSKLGQVFNNLLSNATKFNSDGGWVEIELILMNRNVEVICRDSGIGIPQEAQDKIFTRFYQYDASSTRKYGGTGIGLAIAQDIVRLHGSSISVSSVEGEGSTFRFTLALSPDHIHDNLKDGHALEAENETHILVGLLTQDRALDIQIRDLLLSEGMDVLHAFSPDKAIDLAKKHNPDCMLIDISTSNEASDLIETISAINPDRPIPIILVSNQDDVFESVKDRVAYRLKRDFRKSTLLSSIHNALNKNNNLSKAPCGNKILCIDDDPEILIFVQRCLENEGYVCETCSSGEEGLKNVENGDMGLILMDIAMPGMDGWETCRHLKENPEYKSINIYMVTAKPIDHNTPEMKESHADGFLLKPFRPEVLIQLVHGLNLNSDGKNGN
jgi:PAS domain S-box-containing protein